MSEQFSNVNNQQETLINKGSSETIREIFQKDKISIHRPSHKSIFLFSSEELGYYLAGLIEGDGYISPQNQIVITFNINDSSLAFSLKKCIGFGQIYKIKNKNAIKLVISKKLGVKKILILINGKLRLTHKLKQFLNLIEHYHPDIIPIAQLTTSSLINTYWLSGYSDADASFQIKIITRKIRKNPEIRLYYQLDSKYPDILKQIQENFGGYMSIRQSQCTLRYNYHSTSFNDAKNFINYFDKFQLQSTTSLSDYYKWRKAYLIIQNKEHLTLEGQNKIKNLKETMNKNLEIKIESNNK